MTTRFGWLVLGLVGMASAAHAAADPHFKEFLLRHVCDGGPTPGAVCCDVDQCGKGGTCVVDSIGKLSGTLTLIADDDVTDLDGSRIAGQRVRALTTVIEFKRKTLPLLAQTFQGLNGTDLPSLLQSLAFGPRDSLSFLITESKLVAAVDPNTGDISFLIFRSLDPDTTARLRTEAGLPPAGPEILVITPSKLKLQRFENHFAPSDPNDPNSDTDPFATVLRVKATASYVAPKPAQCP
jgi:hypothetical protein